MSQVTAYSSVRSDDLWITSINPGKMKVNANVPKDTQKDIV